MRINKITQSLLLISVIAVIFNLLRLDIWGTTDLLYLTWNIFLAWIPYIISTYFIKKDTPINLFIPFFIIWFLFFPNAPYLVTDVFHIVSSLPLLLWYDSLLLFLFGWIGLLLGILSLFHIHQYLKNHLSRLASEFAVFLICFVSSFGVYLGRFERWNSWDIFVNPIQLIKYSFNILSNFAYTKPLFMFVIVFTVFMYSVYKTVYVLINESQTI